MIISGKSYLLTLDEPMLANDGLMYICFYGSLYLHDYSETFPFPVKGHVNYFFSIGSSELKEGVILVGGCRVRKAVQMDTPPPILLTNSVRTMGKEGPFDFYYKNYYNCEKPQD